VFYRLWGWLTGKQKVEISVSIKIEDLEKLINLLPRSSSQPVIITQEQVATEQKANVQLATSKGKKKLVDDPLTSEEVASIMLSDGIDKATDRTGNDIVSASEGKSTDDTVSSLKHFLGGKKENG